MPLKIPDGYQRVMPYLIVKDAPAFLQFTKRVFGAEEKLKEMRDERTIAHAEIRIGDSTIMFADSTSKFPPRTGGMFIYVEDADATFRKALSEGAVSISEPADQEHGQSGGVTDPFGNVWRITSQR
jgi:PhnB protein